ncbi:hypothetical protein P153DRAFT_41241 [Dothidotthia symphoricarpi CBS 119687]|uniref:Uncharacterized protein n=1 Tax=Dothidotthia symphoricarpi CBS 119687 TaxID=1392245 RepID=A0A6A6A9W4_9PLEO|nr:uncharacterized protein P153DRAFT_41241 [Dothidotthia symphoricarpi CBS 119687]KAF2128610.1 hypothetical protein P153DRAFT_41241 [Dothidotthia symphoricarpi CBS 119687]
MLAIYHHQGSAHTNIVANIARSITPCNIGYEILHFKLRLLEDPSLEDQMNSSASRLVISPTFDLHLARPQPQHLIRKSSDHLPTTVGLDLSCILWPIKIKWRWVFLHVYRMVTVSVCGFAALLRLNLFVSHANFRYCMVRLEVFM